MPLIRLPEMYYIAAECRISGPDKDLGEARSLLQEVRKARAVYEELDADLDEAGLMAQLERSTARSSSAKAWSSISTSGWATRNCPARAT